VGWVEEQRERRWRREGDVGQQERKD